jgi:hypothetical protein
MVAFLETRVEGLRDMGSHVRISSEKAQRLRAYSDKIQSIIGIIDDIAERTNILAFNAAIEATHAGDKGRGFKVISGEIRSLADKSVSSTRDIALLIDEMRRAISDDIEANARSLAIVEEQISLISDASSTLAELSGRLLEMMSRVRDAEYKGDRGHAPLGPEHEPSRLRKLAHLDRQQRGDGIDRRGFHRDQRAVRRDEQTDCAAQTARYGPRGHGLGL